MANTAHQARNLAAASLVRAFMADDEQAGILIIKQNGGQAAGAAGHDLTQFIIAVTGLAARTLLSAEGYDVDKALKVIDSWMQRYAEQAAQP